MPDNEYPEHEKLHKIEHLSQAIYDFLEWAGEKGILLASYDYVHETWLLPNRVPQRMLLAEHFGIDLKKLEQEKDAMLAAQRALNERT